MQKFEALTLIFNLYSMQDRMQIFREPGELQSSSATLSICSN